MGEREGVVDKSGDLEEWIYEKEVAPMAKISPYLQMESGVLTMTTFEDSFTVFAQEVPSWLLFLDGRARRSKVMVYVEDEFKWFQRSLGLWDFYPVSPFLEEMLELPWPRGQTEKSVVLVQGTKAFATKILKCIADRVRTLSLDVIAVVSGSRMKSSFGIPGLKWEKVSHFQVGGFTKGVHQIGCTPRFQDPSGRPESPCKRDFFASLKVNEGGRSAPAPSVPPGPPHPQDLLGKLTVKSVFSSVTGWVRQKLLPCEIGAAVDLPVDTLDSLDEEVNSGRDVLKNLVTLPPLKLVQSAFQLLNGGFDTGPAPDVSDTPEKVQVKMSLSAAEPDAQAAKISAANAKAVKSDDAPMDEDFWNLGAVTPPEDGCPSAWNLVTGVYDPATHGKIFDFLRVRMNRQFSRNVTSSARSYLQSTYMEEELAAGASADGELEKDLEGIKDALHRVRGASFWDWNRGSFPFFWRWQPEVMRDMRDGTKIWVKGKLPSFRRKQRLPSDPSVAERIMNKVNKVRLRNYIAAGLVLSLTSYFCVPKGESDIRIVYDLTACGLNAVLWAPTFWMPTIQNVLDCATHSSWFGDVDAGEMFLNYPLDENLRPYAGVDVSWSDKEGKAGTVWERWTRMAMGLLPSPWVTTRLFSWAMEIIKGDRTNPLNPFHWSKVVVNCPGDPEYNPGMPRVYKWNERLRMIAGDCKTFVDDLRSVGGSRALCKAVTHRVETLMGYLGLQDATRKRRPDSQTPGEWTGTITRAIEGVGLFVTVSQTKWDKARSILISFLSYYKDPEDIPDVELKDMEKKVGFLVHLVMAYPLMFPFLKGFYLTMNSWRPSQDDCGWKLSRCAFEAYQAASGKDFIGGHDTYNDDRNAPSSVKASPLLYQHLQALMMLFESAEPTLRLIRGCAILEAMYVFGDASGAGFGSTWTGPGEGCLCFRLGVWGEEGDGTSSNYRELRNLVETLELMGS